MKADAGAPGTQPRLAWEPRSAAFAAVCSLPGAVVALGDPTLGLALMVGVLPAAIIGLPPTRRARARTLLLGVLIGVPVAIGGVLTNVPVIAVASILALGPLAARLAASSQLGVVALSLSLPMAGIGLSYPEIPVALSVSALIVAGSAFACVVSMAWPQTTSTGPARPPGPAPTVAYGMRVGAAGATAAAIGYALGLEHVGWASAAAMLVMRPSAEMQRLRSTGRILAVAVGAALAIVLIGIDPAAIIYAAAGVAALAIAAGTHGSRWYVTPAFTTFLVFLLLLDSNPEDAQWRFAERLGETALGVALAYLFGLALPRLLARRGARRQRSSRET